MIDLHCRIFPGQSTTTPTGLYLYEDRGIIIRKYRNCHQGFLDSNRCCFKENIRTKIEGIDGMYKVNLLKQKV